MSNLVIFDLDGVILSEEAYWDAAGLLVHELLYSPRYWNVGNSSTTYIPPQTAQEGRRISRTIFPESVILGLKARSVNSNWDTSYACFCYYLIELLSLVHDSSSLLPLQPEKEEWIAAFRQQLAHVDRESIGAVMYRPLDAPAFQNVIGMELHKRFNVLASDVLKQPVEGVFGYYSPSWKFCQNLFQEWYLGDDLYTREAGHPPSQAGKPGCLLFEEPLLPLEQIHSMLKTLRARGYTLGIATGRPREEAMQPLRNYDLLHYFDEQHLITNAEVTRTEARLHAQGIEISLSKPHPYPFLAAFDGSYQPGEPTPPRGSFVVVGDTTSDVRGGRAAGAVTIAVKTGSRTEEALALLQESQPDFLIEDATQVPELLAAIEDLATIQRMQFSEKAKAELLLQRWFVRHMHLPTEKITLTPKAVSLNSFNGVYQLAGEEYFFKTHVEEQGVVEEYYNAELLHKAGYNIVKPLRTVHEKGQQMVIYPVIHWPVMFDLMRAIELGEQDEAATQVVTAAEKHEGERLLSIYKASVQMSTAEQHAQAPVHQLFWHRLTGERLKSFYMGKPGPQTTDGKQVSFEQLLTYQWWINDVAQHYPLGALIERANTVLNPARSMATVIGHGDAHFGNVFLEQQERYLYFDPAFAGRHSPLLDVVKPLFHNVFATWMYFPFDIARDLVLNVHVDEKEKAIFVKHRYELTSVRQALLETKAEYLLKPLIAWLRSIDALPSDWEEIMQLALMCCPLLTVNLFDDKRMPASVSWLGFILALLMGNNGLALCGFKEA